MVKLVISTAIYAAQESVSLERMFIHGIGNLKMKCLRGHITGVTVQSEFH